MITQGIRGEEITGMVDCRSLTTCSTCAKYSHCVYCPTTTPPHNNSNNLPLLTTTTPSTGACFDQFDDNITTLCGSHGSCSGPACADVCVVPCDASTYPCAESIFGQILLMLFYGGILAGGAKLISDGSEMYLELFPAWGTVIGALLLPILGALPDAFIIIVSGAFGTVDEARENLAVGVGTLAGSTIMLLTVAWSSSMYVGRCDLDELGEAQDEVCSKKTSLRYQGVSVDEDTPTNAKIMLVSSLAYFIVQGIAFKYTQDPAAGKDAEAPLALAGFITCAIGFVAYCVYQIAVPNLAAKRLERVQAEQAQKHKMLKAMSIVSKMRDGSSSNDTSQSAVEARVLAIALEWKRKALADERRENALESDPLLTGGSVNTRESQALHTKGADDGEDESEEEDVLEHFWYNLAKSTGLLLVGTAFVAVFSDPMVDVITDFGKTTKIPAFYVSFIITPFCSNASEFISSLIFASRKRQENASITFSQLYGAATMNNTLSLGLFYMLIYFRGLDWSYSAETMAILFVTWIVGYFGATKRHFRLGYAPAIITLYFLSLALVFVLELPAINWT